MLNDETIITFFIWHFSTKKYLSNSSSVPIIVLDVRKGVDSDVVPKLEDWRRQNK